MPSENVGMTGTWIPKAGRDEECLKLAKELMQSTHADDKGCICYFFDQKANNPRELVLYERWENMGALRAHIGRLQAVYGPPAQGGQLPAAIVEPFEKMDMTRLRVIE